MIMKILQNKYSNYLILICISVSLNAMAQTVSTLTGNSTGYYDGPVSTAQFRYVDGIVTTADGTIFVTDYQNNRIRKITPLGIVSTFAGSTAGYADGTGTAAKFNSPIGIAVDAANNIYVSETSGNRIRKITPDGVVTTIAGDGSFGYQDGNGVGTKFDQPLGIELDTSGNLYVADSGNNRIRKITPDGTVRTIAGNTQGYSDGIGTAALFYAPCDLVFDAMGNLIVTDSHNQRIRKITPDGVVTTLAGSGMAGNTDGTGTAANFFGPYGIDKDAAGNFYIADHFNYRIRKVTPDGVVTTLAGSTMGHVDGPISSALFPYVYSLAIDQTGAILIGDGDSFSSSIRKITGVLGTTDNQIENQVMIYPNPASSIIYLKNVDFTSAKICLFDLKGRKILIDTDFSNGIYIGNLSGGIYMLQITTEKGMVSKKIVKE